jgi:hypothetical protein
MLRGRAHALEYAEGGQHRGVAGAAVGDRPARRVPAFAGDDIHVLAVGADITGCDVATAQRLDKTAVRAQQRLGLEPGRIADDHGLAAAVVQPGQRVLIGHGAGQVQHVRQGRFFARVGVEARPAERGAQGRGVNRDDRPQAGLAVLAEGHLLVPGRATSPFYLGWISVATRVGDCEDMRHGTGSWHRFRSGAAARSWLQPIAGAPAAAGARMICPPSPLYPDGLACHD